MPKSIKIADKSSFFVAICKSSEHSWITLGVTDQGTGKHHTLAYYGKRLAYAKDYQCAGRVKTLFGTVPGVLTRDYKFKEAEKNNVALRFEYKAFEISYENYIEFVKQIKALVKNKYRDHDEKTAAYHKNQLYYPSAEDPNQFDFVDIEKVPDDPKYIAIPFENNIEELGVKDNCRHTVLALLKTFIPRGDRLIKGISTFAYQCLPYQSNFYQDEINDAFYILPIPPSTTDGNKEQVQALITLYKRLEEIPKMKPSSKMTKDKFTAVKALYDSLTSSKEAHALTTKDIASKIKNWELTSATVIDDCRLFKTNRTKTRRMIEDIKKLFPSP